LSGDSVKPRWWPGPVLLLALVALLTLALQFWVGRETIYAKSLEQQRSDLHFAVLENKPPGGGAWAAVGGLSIQKRIGVVYVAEAMRRATGMPIGRIYFMIDTVCLFASMLALFLLLRHWLPEVYCLIGLLYFASMLPLSYFFQLFHPWDRIQLLFWIVLLGWTFQRRFVWLALGLALSVLIKFDTVMLPLLYLLVHFGRRTAPRVLLETGLLFLIGFGIYAALGRAFPSPADTGGFDLNSLMAIGQRNVARFTSMPISYPPLLVHLLPLLLAGWGLRDKPRFAVASVVFALVLSLIYFGFSNYEEVRAHLIVLVLLLPAALISLRRLLDERAAGVAA
jgi:hypothetical protein